MAPKWCAKRGAPWVMEIIAYFDQLGFLVCHPCHAHLALAFWTGNSSTNCGWRWDGGCGEAGEEVCGFLNRSPSAHFRHAASWIYAEDDTGQVVVNLARLVAKNALTLRTLASCVNRFTELMAK